MFFSLFLFLPSSLKSISMSSGEDLKNKEREEKKRNLNLIFNLEKTQ